MQDQQNFLKKLPAGSIVHRPRY